MSVGRPLLHLCLSLVKHAKWMQVSNTATRFQISLFPKRYSDKSLALFQFSLEMAKMDFFDSFSVAFRMWQFTCLSPFSLRKHKIKSIPKNIHRIYSFSIIAIQVLVIILSLAFLKHIIFIETPQTIRTVDTLVMLLLQLTAGIIFYESYTKRFVQIDFLRKINSIDFIFEYKIGISQKYEKQKQNNIFRLCRWLILDLVIFVTIFVAIWYAYVITYRWWTILYASFFICSLRYYQITTFVDIIHSRYCQINQFINKLRPDEDEHKNINVELVKTLQNLRRTDQSCKSGSIYEKLRDLRRVCRSLSSANYCINEMFQWSIPLIIINDFLHILINAYWILRLLLEPKARAFRLIPPSFWMFINLNHVISLSAVCHRATHEVFFGIRLSK